MSCYLFAGLIFAECLRGVLGQLGFHFLSWDQVFGQILIRNVVKMSVATS